MPQFSSLSSWFTLSLVLSLGPLAQAAPEADYLTVSQGASPEVSYQLTPSKGQLRLRVAVDALNPAWPQPKVEAGLAADKTLTLSEQKAKVSQSGSTWIYEFNVNTRGLSAKPDLENLRFAFSVSWLNADGQEVQKENFLMSPGTPGFAKIGTDSALWQPFSLSDHNALVSSLNAQLRVQWEQPAQGVASVVIEDADGVRVRNLISGQRFPAGRQSAVWDGLDEDGQLVPPGDYRWRAITHQGIQPKYLMSYYNPGTPPWKDGPSSIWLGDHSSPVCAASNGESIAIGCPIAEAGNNIVLLDSKGNKFQEGNISSFVGSGTLFLAMDGERFYAFVEGVPHYEKIRKDDKGEEYLYASTSFIAWNIKDGVRHRYEGTGKHGDRILREYRLDPKLDIKHGGVSNLRGAVAINGALYLSLYDENKLIIVNPDNGSISGEIALPKPGALATDGKRLLAYSGTELVLFDQPAAGAKPKKLFTPALSAPRDGEAANTVHAALALRADGRIFAADNGVDQDIKAFDLSGKPLFTIGRKGGGVEEGKWEPNAVRLPMGLALDGEGQLWVAENHIGPKRVSAWKSEDGSLVRELFGPPHYGASGGGFDTKDLSRWLGGASMWKIDVDKNESQLESVLFSEKKKGMPSNRFYPYSSWFLHKDGRTFVISKDGVMRLFEIMPDKRAKLWAMVGTLHRFEAEHPRWLVPEPFTRHPKLAEIYKDFTIPAGPFGNFRNGPGPTWHNPANKGTREYAVLWVDRNGDDIAQVEEFEVAGDADHRMQASVWGYHYENTLDWKFLVNLANDQVGIGELKFKGWLPSGAPDWSIQEAVMNAKPVDKLKSPGHASAYGQDSKGRFLMSSDPMYGIGADNKLLWRYPNQWHDVHGSHKAPLPETGVIQGSLSYLGMAPFDEEGDVTIVNGNHGRFFLLTTDGIYLDEMFQDVRLSRDTSPYRIGGECFGGYFGRDEKSGRYILQSGSTDYRVFEVLGIDQAKRQNGTLKVSPEQIAAAQKLVERKIADEARTMEATIATIEGDNTPSEPTATWGQINKAFPYAKVTSWRHGNQLTLEFEVKDPSPWVNQGKDHHLLFKTGDAIAFEFSTNPKASPGRTQPVPGDKRLLIAPYLDGSVAMLYDYRVPGTKDPVPFASPWRTATVDRVTQLENAQIEVKKHGGGYTVRANFLLSDLGLPEGDGTPLALKGDFGVIYGDEGGHINVLRSYWSNQSTGLVNDVPGETMINPSLWGNLEWK